MGYYDEDSFLERLAFGAVAAVLAGLVYGAVKLWQWVAAWWHTF
jgi:hypothetical protein